MSCRHLKTRITADDSVGRAWCPDCQKHIGHHELINAHLEELRDAIGEAREWLRKQTQPAFGGGFTLTNIAGTAVAAAPAGKSFSFTTVPGPGQPGGRCSKLQLHGPTCPVMCLGPNETGNCGECNKEVWNAATFFPIR